MQLGRQMLLREVTILNIIAGIVLRKYIDVLLAEALQTKIPNQNKNSMLYVEF